MERYDSQTGRDVYASNKEIDSEQKERLSDRLQRINMRLKNLEQGGRIHTDTWRKLMKQKLYIIRIFNKK